MNAISVCRKFLYILFFVLTSMSVSGTPQSLEDDALDVLRSRPLMLLGASSSGKTTSTARLLKELGPMVHLEHVAFFNLVVEEQLEKFNPSHVKRLKKLLGSSFLHVVFNTPINDSETLQKVPDDSLKETLVTLQEYFRQKKTHLNELKFNIMRQNALHLLAERKPVSLGVRTSESVLEGFEGMNSLKIALFCPLEQLVQRSLNRNMQSIAAGNFSQYRPPQEFLDRLLEVLIFSREKLPGKQEIETVSEGTLYRLGSLISSQPRLHVDHEDLNDFLTRYNKESKKPVHVYFPHACDYFVRVQNKTEDAVFQEILECIFFERLWSVFHQRQRLFHRFAHSNAKQSALYLLCGVSSGGKSTLCHGLKRYREDLKVINFDGIFFKNCFEFLEKEHPGPYANSKGFLDDALLYYMFSPLDSNHPFSKHFVSKTLDDTAKLEEDISILRISFQIHIDSIYWKSWWEAMCMSYAHNSFGYIVIVDSAVRDPVIKFWADNYPLLVRPVLIYRGLISTLRLLNRRNEQAITSRNPLEWRDPLPLVRQFFSFYNTQNDGDLPGNSLVPLRDQRRVMENSPDNSLEKLTKNEVFRVMKPLKSWMSPLQYGDMERIFDENLYPVSRILPQRGFAQTIVLPNV